MILAIAFGAIFNSFEDNYNICPQYCAIEHEHIIKEKNNE